MLQKIEVTATVLALFSLDTHDRAKKTDEHDIYIFSTTSIKEFMYFWLMTKMNQTHVCFNTKQLKNCDS